MQLIKKWTLPLLMLTFISNAYAQNKTKGCVEGNCENGWGIYEYYVGEIYQGRYEGYFQDGKRAGKGKFIYANGDKYEGGWVAGKPHGIGAKISKGGKVKSGQWADGKFVKKLEKK